MVDLGLTLFPSAILTSFIALSERSIYFVS